MRRVDAARRTSTAAAGVTAVLRGRRRRLSRAVVAATTTLLASTAAAAVPMQSADARPSGNGDTTGARTSALPAHPSESRGAPPVTRHYAHELGCRHIHAYVLPITPPNRGVTCVRAHRHFVVVKYRYTGHTAALRWKERLEPTEYVTRKGPVFMVDMGGTRAYTLKWSTYFKRKVGGHLVQGTAGTRTADPA